jgi:hypothetical protein
MRLGRPWTSRLESGAVGVDRCLDGWVPRRLWLCRQVVGEQVRRRRRGWVQGGVRGRHGGGGEPTRAGEGDGSRGATMACGGERGRRGLGLGTRRQARGEARAAAVASARGRRERSVWGRRAVFF